jgi:hypothetical protein
MKSLLMIGLGTFSTFITGLCLSILWLWFITPLGVPAITALHGMGLCYVGATLFGKKDPNPKVDAEKILYVLLYDGFALLFGYLTHLAM